MPGELLLGIGALLDEDLHEGALLLGSLPRKRLLARRDLHHEVADAFRFARLHHQVLRQVVALVEDAQGDHTVLVGRADVLALSGLRRPRLHPGDGIGDTGILRLWRGFTAAASGQCRKRDKNRKGRGGPLHATDPQPSGDAMRMPPSGDQAS